MAHDGANNSQTSEQAAPGMRGPQDMRELISSERDDYTERSRLLSPFEASGVGRLGHRTPPSQAVDHSNIQRQILSASREGGPLAPGRQSPVVYEDDDNIVIRQPIRYYSINSPNGAVSSDPSSGALLSRYRYYGRLDPRDAGSFLMPAHVVPSPLLVVIPFQTSLTDQRGQHSVVTIFALWTTMMGTSILSLPWAFQQAGFATAIFFVLFIAAMSLYTAYIVTLSPSFLAEEMGLASVSGVEFPQVLRYYLGKWGERSGLVFGLFALLCGAIVYWVLMSNFLYNSVDFIYEKTNNDFDNFTDFDNNTSHNDVYCPSLKPVNKSAIIPDNTFNRVWRKQLTVPFFLLILVFPLLNFKSATFFTKFNFLGTISLIYMLSFITAKAVRWGFNMNFMATAKNPVVIPEFRTSFPALTGILALAYFIHNAILSIMRNQRHPENNRRDIIIAYIGVTLTYLFIGIIFYTSFPLDKSCIEDNLMNNFRSDDIPAFVGRLFFFVQLVAVYPLILYIFRDQTFTYIYNESYPSLKHVVVFNMCIIAVCLIFAVLYPKIGQILGVAGAVCGLVYMFALPCIVFMIYRYRKGTLTPLVVIIHIGIITLGVLNFIGAIIIKIVDS